MEYKEASSKPSSANEEDNVTIVSNPVVAAIYSAAADAGDTENDDIDAADDDNDDNTYSKQINTFWQEEFQREEAEQNQTKNEDGDGDGDGDGDDYHEKSLVGSKSSSRLAECGGMHEDDVPAKGKIVNGTLVNGTSTSGNDDENMKEKKAASYYPKQSPEKVKMSSPSSTLPAAKTLPADSDKSSLAAIADGGIIDKEKNSNKLKKPPPTPPVAYINTYTNSNAGSPSREAESSSKLMARASPSLTSIKQQLEDQNIKNGEDCLNDILDLTSPDADAKRQSLYNPLGTLIITPLSPTTSVGPPTLESRTSVASVPGDVRERGPDYLRTENGLASYEFDVRDNFSTTESATHNQEYSEDDLEGNTPNGNNTNTSDNNNNIIIDNNNDLVNAMAVTDAEKVVYAKDVQPDTIRRKFAILRCIVAAVTVALIVSLSVTLRRKDEPPESVDQRCESVPLAQQNAALQCLCTNSSQAIVDSFTDFQWDVYEFILHNLQNSSLLGEGEVVDPTACTPEANSILSMVQLVEEEVQFENARQNPILVDIPYALFMLYNKLDGIHWVNATGWDEPGVSLSSFHGVEVFFLGQVTRIELPNNGLNGTIPSEIQHLSSLRVLDLSDNPGLVGTIPSAIGELTTLNELKLSETSIEGTIPSFLSRLQRLDILHLREMKLQGTIPPEIFSERLRSIDFSRNHLIGTLSSSISRSPRLQSLQLQFNQLSGTLPQDGMGGLSELELLNLSVNNFTGSIPEKIGQLHFLEFTSFIESGVSGLVPETFCEDPSFVRQIIGDCEGELALIPNCTCCAMPEKGVTVLCKEEFPIQALHRILT